VDKTAVRDDQNPKKSKALIRKIVVFGYLQGAIFIALWSFVSHHQVLLGNTAEVNNDR
jgi:hypothetical protein